ncbi:flagellar protein FlgJ [Anaerovirgula multivorans]|uniref:Flagellar protein FlgJ n=1 Tax=Anaerovirgula multivorans TaxID=312168 RepID=A0A239EYU8_9FIRM|nr:rod-binding protein [Anaerovirgula multivorans]SNS49767.1 flagellar protein FlgJ [Anaerovirgula multivorans]
MKINDSMIHLNNSNKIENKAKTTKTPEDPEKLMEVCREFESIFLNMMLQQMRRTVPDGGLVEKSYARDLYESLQDEEVAKEMSKGGGIGLAQELYTQLSRTTKKPIE